jgi:hypothetical protein
LPVEGRPVKPVRLERLVGFHPIDGFTQFVEVAQGEAVTLGIQPPLKGFGHEAQLLKGQVAFVLIQPLEISPGPRAAFGQRRPAAAGAGRQSARWIKGQHPLQPKVQLPIGREVLFIAEALAAMQAETGKRHLSGIVPEGDTAQARDPVRCAMDQEAVQVVVAPSEGALKDCMEFGQAGVAGHEQTPPHQRAHAAEHDAKLINRKGQSGRFSHAGTLPNPPVLLRI